MTEDKNLAHDLYNTTGEDEHNLDDPNVAHVMVHHNQVISSQEIPGLHVSVEEEENGIRMTFTVDPGTIIEKPVHLCFGMMPEEGLQEINMETNIGDGAEVYVRSHCTFPFAKEVVHKMDAVINIGREAKYSYFERHIHSKEGGVTVIPKARVNVDEGGRFNTEFELIKGRVGAIDIEYETTCAAYATMEMTARINGSGDDTIRINEIGHLHGEHARGVLVSHVAVQDRARADILNTLTATAAHARGHVDCKEIIQDEAVARAVPIVEVRHPRAHITHEAAIGSVDTKQLETLMSRGLDEEAAVDLIIQGLLS